MMGVDVELLGGESWKLKLGRDCTMEIYRNLETASTRLWNE